MLLSADAVTANSDASCTIEIGVLQSMFPAIVWAPAASVSVHVA